jgi:PAS domain S-box-containing protein
LSLYRRFRQNNRAPSDIMRIGKAEVDGGEEIWMMSAWNANAYKKVTGPEGIDNSPLGQARQIFIRSEPGEAVLERVVGALCAVDRSGRFTYLNQAAERLLEKKREEVIGYDVRAIMPDFCRTLTFARLQQAAAEGRETEFETTEIREGSWLSLKAMPADSGLTVYCRDITAEKRAAEELKRAEEKFAVAFNAGPNMISIISRRERRYLDVNRVWLAGTGYRREEIIGKKVEELSVWAGSDYPRILAAVAARGESRQNREVTFKTKTGETRIGLAAIEPVSIGGEECLLCSINDITPLRRLEKEIARLDRLNLVGRMAAGLGHEIRNPLTVVRGYTQLLAGRNELKAFGEYFQAMLAEIDQANRVISEYLALAKDRSVHLETGSLNDILTGVLPQLEAKAASRRCRVIYRPEKCLPVRLDREEIQQMVLNLAGNSFDAMPEGGTLTIHTGTENGMVFLTIRDQGGGIPPEIYECLGTPFVTTKENGTGLGLAICYSIAARHGAAMEADTGPEGTAFTISFPAAENYGAACAERNLPDFKIDKKA